MKDHASKFLRTRRAFTLVELLVVVTIIVVLLSLLVPAIDQAIYRTELTVCATRLRAIATGMNTYAVQHSRWYPHNRYLDTGAGWHAPLLRHGGQGAAVQGNAVVTGSPLDMRSYYRPYFPIAKTLTDPMIRTLPVDLDTTDHNLVYGSYSLWNSWKWTAAAKGTKRQNKIGDRFDWTDAGGVQHSWDILAGDFMRSYLNATGVPTLGYWSAHPSPRTDSLRLAVVNGPNAYGTMTIYSYWISAKIGRDEVDYNIARQDESVQALDNVTFDDTRLVSVPEYPGNPGANGEHIQLPSR